MEYEGYDRSERGDGLEWDKVLSEKKRDNRNRWKGWCDKLDGFCYHFAVCVCARVCVCVLLVHSWSVQSLIGLI